MKKWLWLGLVLFPGVLSAAQIVQRPQGYVSDFANILDPATEQSLENQIAEYERATSHEIAVVTVPSLEGDTVDSYAVDLFKQWGIGKKGKDNGVLILVAPNERKVRIEVGYGLEELLTDARCGDIIREALVPAFKQGQYGQGVTAAFLAVKDSLEGRALEPRRQARNEFREWFPSLFALALVFFGLVPFTSFCLLISLFTILALQSRVSWLSLLLIFPGLLLDWKFGGARRRRWMNDGGTGGWRGSSYSGGGFGGGGFGGFGGGSSGGGGASGSW